MPGKRTLVASIAALAAGLTVPAAAGAATVLKANMTGAQVVNSDGGAPSGVAHAMLRVNAERARVCFEIEYSGLGGKATAGYLRRGEAGQMARPLATLFVGRAASPVSGCVDELSPRAVRRLDRRPQAHYLDLATRRYSRGAVRGQLRFETRSDLGGAPSGGSPAGP